MKTSAPFFIIFFFIISGLKISAQEIDSIPLKNDSAAITMNLQDSLPEIFNSDNILKLISHFIPMNWNINLISDTLVFMNISPVYKLSESQRQDTIHKGRGKIKELLPQKAEYVSIKFLLQPPWTASQLEDAKLKNSHTFALIDKLLKKYKITHLSEIINSDTFNVETANLTTNEKKSVLRYFEEKEKLEKELITTPNYHTSDFSMFLLDIYPEKKDQNLYTPPGIIMDIYVIIGLFEKYAGK